MHIYLYGSGNRCRILLELIRLSDIKIAGIVDSNPSRHGNRIYGYEVLPVDQLKKCADEYVCVTFFGDKDYEPVWEDLTRIYKVAKNRIMSCHDLIRVLYQRIITIPMTTTDISIRKKVVFAKAWDFGVGGVETWIDETGALLLRQSKDVYLLAKKDRYIEKQELIDNVIDFCVDDSCDFKKNDVERTVTKLVENAPCVLVCSRADEVLLSAAMLHKVYSDSFRIIAVIHGACDGIIRDFYAYDDVIDRYICVSTAVQRALVALGVEKDRTEIITSPIADLSHGTRAYSLDINNPVKIGYAGRLEVFHKRSDLLIQLVKKLEFLKVNYCFEIVGDGSFSRSLKQFIEDNNLQEKVCYKGLIERKAIYDFWIDKDIAVNVSESEGRPISNIEAMICGVVPVVTATAGILDDVIDGDTGYTVDIGDMDSMARVIEYLANNRSCIKETGERAREYISKKTDVRSYEEQWSRILEVR
ncbi:MAG TPA: hypothetical protein DCX21_00290 [Eubacterium sp.]|nr:hypothetical protein [Eubacterium sp.]